MGRRKKPLALPSAAFTTYFGPTASSSSSARDTAVEPNGGCISPIWRRSHTCLFILGWIPKGRATASATAPSWSMARLVHVPAGNAFVIVLAQRRNLHLGGVAFGHRPQHQEWGSSLSSACLGRSCSYIYTHIQQASPTALGI